MIRIRGEYQGKKETVDTATSARDAYYLLREYQIAFGKGWRLWITGLKREDRRES